MITPELVHYTPHAVATGFIGWLIKYVGSAIRTEWRDAKAKLDTIANTTQVQAENHLHTIQENTSKTNDLLGKVVEGQAEMNGFLRGRL